jgi:hypothetical protein
VNLFVPLFGAQPVAGGENGDGMAAQPQRFGHGQAMIVKSSGVVRRIQICHDQNFIIDCQPSGRGIPFVSGKNGRASRASR